MLPYLVTLVLMLVAAKAEDMECGVGSDNGESSHLRIVGGEEAERNGYPWQVMITHSANGMCGGSIISKNKILTGALCTHDKQISSLEVYVGFHNRAEKGAFKQVCGKVEHGDYGNVDDGSAAFAVDNDIAILTLCEDLEFSESVRSICLPDSDYRKYSNSEAEITGWGITSEPSDKLDSNGTFPDTLQAAKVKIIENEECNKHYDGHIQDTMICAMGEGRICMGDAGGPLAVIENGRYTVVGIASFGGEGCNATYPGVYTRVSSFMSGILDYI